MKYFKIKHIYSTLLGALLLMLASATYTVAQKTYTDSKHFQDLSEYQTYDWVFSKELIPEDHILIDGNMTFIYNNETSNAHIKEAIEVQMEARGFAHDENNPDMLVNFRILEQPTEMRTYTMTNGQDYLGFGPRSTNSKMVPVEAGTVIVNFLDADSGNQIWQGFASGAFDVEDLKDISNLEAKIISIFNDWNFENFTE